MDFGSRLLVARGKGDGGQDKKKCKWEWLELYSNRFFIL